MSKHKHLQNMCSLLFTGLQEHCLTDIKNPATFNSGKQKKHNISN